MPTIDFEGNQQNNTNPGGNAGNNPNGNGGTNPANEPDTTHLNGGGAEDITGKNNNNNPNPNPNPTSDPNPNPNNPNNPNPNNQENNNNEDTDLEEGTEVEFEGVVYKVDKDGNLVNDKGEIFKEAKDVKQWLKDNNITDEEEDTELTIDSIKSSFGIEITDDSGKPVEFTNDPAGVKAYLDAVYNLKAAEIQQGAINKLFNDNPMVKQFIDYVKIKGTPKGFGDIPDRSGITLDRENETQQEAIIKMAAEEFGNKSLDDNYIKYLKSTGGLYDVAKVQLEALVAKDKQTRKDIETQAAAARQQEEQEAQEYWNSVDKAIKERRIGGYLLPETIIKEVNGQKITYKLDDFYDYVSNANVVDAKGNKMTGYTRDLNKLTDKEVLERDLLDAWLLWTGGSYKNLVDMAIKEEGVRRLVAKSKENKTSHRIVVNKPNKSGDKNQLVFE